VKGARPTTHDEEKSKKKFITQQKIIKNQNIILSLKTKTKSHLWLVAMDEKTPHSIEAEEDSYTMGDSLTANAISPQNKGGSNSSSVYMSKARFTSMSNNEHDSADFEDHPRRMGENSNSSADNVDDEYYDSDSDEEDEDEEERDEPPLSLEELLYSASSYHAIVRPVSATMILAALASVYINTEESRELGQEQFASAYNIWSIDSDGSVGKNLIASVGNTFIMVLGIGTMTFGIVLLYKYR